MISSNKIYREICLIMTEDEAQWLKATVQNPHPSYKGDEPDGVNKIRQSFWDALDSEGVKI